MVPLTWCEYMFGLQMKATRQNKIRQNGYLQDAFDIVQGAYLQGKMNICRFYRRCVWQCDPFEWRAVGREREGESHYQFNNKSHPIVLETR